MNDIIEALKKFNLIKLLAAVTVMISLVAIIYALINKAIPAENKEAVIHVLGIIEGGVISIVSFYFGSSQSSQRKDELLNGKP
jgi:xanthosine utilization system XapX-like protein